MTSNVEYPSLRGKGMIVRSLLESDFVQKDDILMRELLGHDLDQNVDTATVQEEMQHVIQQLNAEIKQENVPLEASLTKQIAHRFHQADVQNNPFQETAYKPKAEEMVREIEDGGLRNEARGKIQAYAQYRRSTQNEQTFSEEDMDHTIGFMATVAIEIPYLQEMAKERAQLTPSPFDGIDAPAYDR